GRIRIVYSTESCAPCVLFLERSRLPRAGSRAVACESVLLAVSALRAGSASRGRREIRIVRKVLGTLRSLSARAALAVPPHAGATEDAVAAHRRLPDPRSDWRA